MALSCGWTFLLFYPFFFFNAYVEIQIENHITKETFSMSLKPKTLSLGAVVAACKIS